MNQRDDEAPFAFGGLERIFHERGRLAICACLTAHPEGMAFTDLQRSCGLTDGNLNRHLHALSELAIVTMTKRTRNGRSLTLCKITRAGRARFLAYIDELESVVRDVQARADERQRAGAPRLVEG